MMNKLRNITMALAAVFVLGLLTSAQAQSGRTIIFKTATYEFKGNQVGSGLLSGNTYYATFSGEAKTTDSKVAVSLRSVTLSVQYTSDGGGTGTLVGGTWTLVTLTKDRPAQTFGGAIPAGGQLALKSDNTLAQGALSLVLLAGDPDWPISGSFSGSLDKSRPARLSGSLILTYPVVL